jgi:hypothetical protein
MVRSVGAIFILVQEEHPYIALPTPGCSMFVVGVTSGREKEELPSLLCVARPKVYGNGALCQALDVMVARSLASASGSSGLVILVHVCMCVPSSSMFWRPPPVSRPRWESNTGSFPRKELLCCGTLGCSNLVKLCLSVCASVV